MKEMHTAKRSGSGMDFRMNHHLQNISVFLCIFGL